MSRKACQVSILATWVLSAVVYVWILHIDPPHDEDYGKWLFLSLLDTAGPWIYCSVPLVLIVLSFEVRHRPRRTWIIGIWAAVVICVAWVKLHPAFNSASLQGLDMQWAFPARQKALKVEILADEVATEERRSARHR